VRELVDRHRRFKKGLQRLKGLSHRLHALFEQYETTAALAGSRQANL
jgi:hypothetical protein